MRSCFLIFWKTLTNRYRMGAQITINYRLLHRCSLSSRIIGWVRSVMIKLLNGWKTFYLNGIGWKRAFMAKSMMKPLNLGYQKIDMCPSFYMLYYLENIELTEYRICGYARYKPKIGRGRTLVTSRKLNTSQLHIDYNGYSCHNKTIEHMASFTWYGGSSYNVLFRR